MNKPKQSFMMLSGNTEKLFCWQTLLLSAAGLAINLALAKLVIRLGLPLYIDNVGSLLVGALAGPIPGALVGFLSNAVNALQDPITMYYGILTIIMAILASYYSKKGLLRSLPGCAAAVGSFVCVGGAAGSVMTWLLYGGGIGGIGAPLATRLNGMGLPALLAQLLADMVIDLPDKLITVCLVVVLLRLCTRLFPDTFPLSAYYEMPLAQLKQNNAQKEPGRRSVNVLILRLIILCCALVSSMTILAGFHIYCGFTQDMQARQVYLIQLASVSFAVSILICVVTVWLATHRISEPLNRIVQQSRTFMAMPSENWLESDAWKQRAPVTTGDEIEELYHTICIEQETVAHNVMRMKETEEQLRHSKELEDALETARKASEAKGQFLSRMSHEIRTPLNAVIGYMDIAAASPDDNQKLMHCVHNSKTAATHLLHIINDVLDVSSIESGKMEICAEEFNLKEQLNTVCTMFHHQAQENGVRFDTVLNGPVEEWLVGDSLRLNQILMNLLSNAVKFTPAGGRVELNLLQLQHSDNRIYLKFEVKDTGIGIGEEFQSHLFRPFEQESAVTAQKYGGTGLGLSITGNLVSMMNGAIAVTSKQGEGSCFTVTLPFSRPTAAHPAPTVDTGRRLRVLVAGDTAHSKETKALFRSCGLHADVAAPEAAARQFRVRESGDYAYDCCFLDWDAGADACAEAAREIGQLREGIRLTALAYDVGDIADSARAAGVTRLLAKPLFHSTIAEGFAEFLGTQPAAPTVSQPQDSLAGLHVLLAEDNDMNREIAVSILQKAGLQVTSAENGRRAVELFAASPAAYQAILMDIQMPVLDGLGATREIRGLAVPEAKTIPIIAMTANAFHEDVAAALSAGMNDHIAKPVNYDKLFGALRKLT